MSGTRQPTRGLLAAQVSSSRLFSLRFQVKAGVEQGQPIEAIGCVANRSGLKQVATKKSQLRQKVAGLGCFSHDNFGSL